MKRILHLISHLEEGGAQRQLAYLLSFSKRYDFEIASLIGSPPEKFFPFFRNANLRIHSLSQSGDFYAPEILPNLEGLLKSHSFDLVHCWLYQSIAQGVIASRKQKIPCIASPRSMSDAFQSDQNRLWERYFIRKTLRVADLVLCPSNSIASDFLDLGWIHPERTRVVHNGVDVDYFHPSQGGNLIVAVGRQSVEKAYDDFESIARGLRKAFPEIRCVVVGGAKRDSDCVEFTGRQEDVREILRNTAIYISTSRTEGMSNALLEAQSMGIPAVVRELGSNSEVLENGVNGFLVKTVEEFVQACKTLLNNESLRKEMGQLARARIQAKFAIQNQIKKVESIYSELL